MAVSAERQEGWDSFTQLQQCLCHLSLVASNSMLLCW